MKKMLGLLAGCAMATMFALPTFAATLQPETSIQDQCTDESKAALYKTFTDLRTTDLPKAYDAAKKYLGCSQQDDQYTAYLKKWVTAYDKESRKLKIGRASCRERV